MKKIATLFLVFTMLFSLVACGGETTNNDGGTNANNTTNNADQTSTSQEETTKGEEKTKSPGNSKRKNNRYPISRAQQNDNRKKLNKAKDSRKDPHF